MVIPVGVTRSTVEGVLKGDSRLSVSCVVGVSVSGFESEKEVIFNGIEFLAGMIGARFYRATLEPGDPGGVVRLYDIIRGESFERLVVVGVTGSRYLQPLLYMIALQVWRDRGRRVSVCLLLGVEGGEARLVPLAGFFAPVMKITRVQLRVLDIIYGSGKPVSGKDLIERYGFTRSVYYVLADLERKGLVSVKRGVIERTFPGELFYQLHKASMGGE